MNIESNRSFGSAGQRGARQLCVWRFGSTARAAKHAIKTVSILLTVFVVVVGTASSQPVLPQFLIQPTNQSVSLGANAAFSFEASGTAPLYYYLQGPSLAFPGKTNATSFVSASLVVTNVQMADAGAYIVIVTNPAGSVTSQVAHLEVDATFTKITTDPLVTVPGTYLACAWGDYDNDGFPDLVITCANSGAPQRNVLFHNNGNGTFTKLTTTAISAEARDWRGCAWADYDNDGYLDLYVVSDNSRGFGAQNELFRNNGDGTFTKMTPASVGAIVPGGGNCDGPAWSDYDRDGFVDVFVAGFGQDWLFRNSADGHFSSDTNSGILLSNEGGYRAAWGDYDNDGWPDLSVQVLDPSLTPMASVAYHALGGGMFANFVPGLQRSYSNSVNILSWADYDNDGYPDVIVPRNGGQPNLVYHNNGDGSFTLMTSNQVGSIASDLLNAWMCVWGDYDNDGFLDVFLLRDTWGGILYHNNGAGGFTRVLSGSPVNDFIDGAAAATWVDYDNDGFLDLFVPCNGGDSISTNFLYHNNGNTNGWLKVKLVGTASNRSAIGAKMRVQATIRGRSMWQLREINTGDGFSGPPLEAHFGLGDATNVDQVRIEWPSGIVQILTNVPPRQFITVTEHQQISPTPPRPMITSVSPSANGLNMDVNGEHGLLYVFEASTNLANWTKVGVRSNATGVVSFTDARATNYTGRFYRVSIP